MVSSGWHHGRDVTAAWLRWGVTPWPAQGRVCALQGFPSPGTWLGGTIPGGDVTGGRGSADHPWPQSTCAFNLRREWAQDPGVCGLLWKLAGTGSALNAPQPHPSVENHPPLH